MLAILGIIDPHGVQSSKDFMSEVGSEFIPLVKRGRRAVATTAQTFRCMN